jgi:hypothetical protein
MSYKALPLGVDVYTVVSTVHASVSATRPSPFDPFAFQSNGRGRLRFAPLLFFGISISWHQSKYEADKAGALYKVWFTLRKISGSKYLKPSRWDKAKENRLLEAGSWSQWIFLRFPMYGQLKQAKRANLFLASFFIYVLKMSRCEVIPAGVWYVIDLLCRKLDVKKKKRQWKDKEKFQDHGLVGDIIWCIYITFYEVKLRSFGLQKWLGMLTSL